MSNQCCLVLVNLLHLSMTWALIWTSKAGKWLPFLLLSILIMLTTNEPWKTKLIEIHQSECMNLTSRTCLTSTWQCFIFWDFWWWLKMNVSCEKCNLCLCWILNLSLGAIEQRSNCKTSCHPEPAFLKNVFLDL